MSEVAFLVYSQKEKQSRRVCQAFDIQTNAGVYVIVDTLRRAGIEVGFCSPETAHHYRVVLVSFASTFDVYNFIRAVGRLNTWRKRSFFAVGGGFGVQNIYPLRRWLDYAVYGRGEAIAANLVKSLLKKQEFYHESVLVLEDGIRHVKVAQAPALYPHEITVRHNKDEKTKWSEHEIGCPLNCYFCHYRYARRHLRDRREAFKGNMNYASSAEVLFSRLLKDADESSGRIRTALDGFSQHLRFAFNKRISDDEIRETIYQLSLRWQGKLVWLNIYMIGSYPTETEETRLEFEEFIRSLDPPGKRVVLLFFVTPFRPAPLTPSAYLPANIDFNWNALGRRVIVEKPNLGAFYAIFLEGPWPHLLSLLSERARPETDEIINAVCFSSRLARMKTRRKIEALDRSFDLEPYLREYSTREDLPTWYVQGWVPEEKIRQAARKLKAALGIKEQLRGTESTQD